MEATKRPDLESELLTQALYPLAMAYQDAIVAREPAERFARLGYLHEVILKCLAAQMVGRVRALELDSPELLDFLRDSFRQPSTGDWAQLLATSQKLLTDMQDRPAQFLNGRLGKKLHDPDVLKLDQMITELLGHTYRSKNKVSVAELFQSLIEMRNKTRGHGAPRRAFFEDINPLIEASLLLAIKVLQPHLWGKLAYIEQITAQDGNALLEGQVLVGLTRHPWQATFIPAPWIRPQCLYLLESTEDAQQLYPLDPLLVWSPRDESVGFYNGYVESKQQMEYLLYARGKSWHDRSRLYEEAFGLPAAQQVRSPETMKIAKLWSNKGVALYPVDFPLVGQNDVFNSLFKFKQAFTGSQADDIAGFFALIGDWGLGKTRIGYELFAQTFNHVERWVLNQDEFIVPNAADGRLLQPQLAEGILPLYVRYDMVCDEDLYAENWIARTAGRALRLVAQHPGGYDVPPALLDELRAALKARGVDLAALDEALGVTGEDDDAQLSAAMEILRAAGIRYLWVVVDEVETLADLKKGLRTDDHEPIHEDYLDMVSTVIKHENYRQAHPYVNFLVLCSLGMRDKIEIGPNRRRTDSVELEPNRIGDVRRYVDYLHDQAEVLGQAVNYPPGTLEGAFIACNRNFGWLNVMMSSIHESYRLARGQGKDVNAWQLVEEFARAEPRAKWIFDLSVLGLLQGVKQAPEETVNRLVFGQLPISLQDGLDEAQIKALQKVTVPGIPGPAFVELVEVHLDAGTLAAELVKPEIGFKPSPRGGDWFIYYNSEISLNSLLAALRAFSVGVSEGNFCVCSDLNAFTAQLGALYERPTVDTPQIAEPLHGIFCRYQETARRYLGPSFALLQRLDILLQREVGTVAFLQDAQKDAELTKYADAVDKSERKRQVAICQGFARLLDDTLSADASSVPQMRSAAAVTFVSGFQSPRFEGLQVTPEGRATIVYGQDLEKLHQELGDLLGQEGVHPIIVLLPAGALIDWEQVRALPRVRLCAIPRALTRIEEAFLVKYSGRGTVFQPQDLLSAKTQSIRGVMEQNWRRDTLTWREDAERKGYLLRPLWHSKRVSEVDFARGYRAMLLNGWNIDQLAPDVNPVDGAFDYENVRKACQYNADPGPGQEPLLEVITRAEPYEPLIPPAFGALLQELKSQASLQVLARRFFFAVPEKKTKAVKQLEQILELLRALGLVTLAKSTYRAVDVQTLKDYRQATSAWLNGECQALLAELGDTFTQETVGKLQKQSTSFAPKELEEVEQVTAQVEFARIVELGGNVPADDIRALVRQIGGIERRLSTICPPGIYQQTGAVFECATDQIATIEQKLNALSLWDQVRFFHWLREQYRQRRDQLANAVAQQLAEASALSTVGGHPFPVAALTQPLKAIAEEVKSTLSAGAMSSRGAIPVPGYAHPTNVFLFMGQYANAWQRLTRLGQYVERAQPTSFWARFQTVRDIWTERVNDYERASEAWEAVSKFVGDASSPAWQGKAVKAVRANLEQLRVLVEGGLQQTVNLEIDQGADKLIETLDEEVHAAKKYATLPNEIEALRQEIEAELKAFIDQGRLQALSRVLAARRRSQLAVPPLAATYAETKAAYEAFNVQVVETGRRYFEGAGQETLWDRWVEIYLALREERYVPSSEDETALRELEEMKLVERTVKLR